MKNKAKKTFTPAKQNFLLRVPANATGDRFIHQLKTYMNGDSYSIKKRYTGICKPVSVDITNPNVRLYQ